MSDTAAPLHDPQSSAWRAALRRLPHDTYHLPAYVAATARLASGRPCAFIYEDRDQLLLLPLVVRPIPATSHVDAVSPYGYPGPVATTDDPSFWGAALRSFVHTLRSHDVVSCFVRLHPLLPAPLAELEPHGKVVRHGSTVSIDLTRSTEDTVAGFRANHRRQISHAHLRGMNVTVDEWHRLGAFVEIYHETMARVGATADYFLPAQHFAQLHAELGQHVHLLLVHAPATSDVLAGGLFLEAAGIVQYHLGATRTEALPCQPAKLMFAHVCQWGRARSNRSLHLGGGVGGSDADSLFHFKAGFSDRRHPFHTWRVVVDDKAYQALVPGAERRDTSGYFPAYRSLPASSVPTNWGQDR